MKQARKLLAVLATTALILLFGVQGVAGAVNGLGGLDATGGSNQSEPYTPQVQEPAGPGDPTDDSDSEGHETEDPEKPDHASGEIAEVTLAGEHLVTVGGSDASVGDDGTTRSDATVLAVLGSEIIGSHSECNEVGCDTSDSVVPTVLCEETGGTVCVGLLYAMTGSSTADDESSASADQAIAFACVGSDQTAPDSSCSGLVGAGASENHSEVHQDNTTGATETDQTTDAADTCVGPTGEDPITGICSGVGVGVLHSESHSDAPSETGPGSTERSSYVAQVELAGSAVLTVSEPTDLSLPPGCPDGSSLLCVYLNQGESFVYTGGAASRQEALHVSVLPAGGTGLTDAHSASAETLAENTGPACPPGATRADCVPCPDTGLPRMPNGVCPREPVPPAATVPGLANTGMNAIGVGLVGLTLILLGSMVMTWERRRLAAAPGVIA